VPADGLTGTDGSDDTDAGLRLAVAAIAAITSGTERVTFQNFDGKGGLMDPTPPAFAATPAYYAAGLLSWHIVGPAKVLGVEHNGPDLRIAAVENDDGSTTIMAVNLAEANTGVNLYSHTHKANFRIYTYAVESPPTNAFADLPECADQNTHYGKRGGIRVSFPGNALTILRTEPDTERPERVRFVDVSDAADGGKRLSWDPISEHRQCIYRVYRMNMPRLRFARKQQIGSTAGTAWLDASPPEGKRWFYGVVAVDAYGNTSE
jgi:hypothetical protein